MVFKSGFGVIGLRGVRGGSGEGDERYGGGVGVRGGEIKTPGISVAGL